MTSLRACYSTARCEALDYGLLYPLAEQLLDRCKLFRFIGTDERHGVAFAPRACRAPDTVHIVLGNVRQLVVHDHRQIVNVESLAAISVATRTRTFPRLKSARARVRAPWVLSP